MLARAALWVVAALLVQPVSALAPDKAFHQYIKDVWSIEEGLPQITVLAITQGPDGYIWAATQAGVARFDGVRFTNFEPVNTPEIPGLYTQALYVDHRDRIWVGTYKGATYFADGRFHAIDDGFGRDIDVFQFAESAEGHLMAATDRGLLRETGDVLVHHAGDPDGPLRSLFQHQGRVLVGGSGEILIDEGDGWQRTELTGKLGSALVNEFTHYNGRFWAATTSGLLYREEGRWQQFDFGEIPNDIVIETIYPDRDGNLWVGAANRLLRLQGDKLVENIPDEAPAAHESVMSMAEDHEGNLWVGSRWEGLARIWDSWVFRYGRPEGLHNSLVWSVARDESGNIWTGTMDGLAVFRDGRFEQLTEGSEQPHPHAYTLLPEEDRVWVGTRTGLFWWDRVRETMVKPEAFEVLDAAHINGIIRRQDDSYWLASFQGVWRWNGERFQRMAARGELGGQDVRVLLETRAGRLLAGTRRGMLEYSAADKRFHRVPGVAENQDFTMLHELDDGSLVAGTLDERLWFGIGGQWHEFGTEHGLPTNSPFAVGEHRHSLWIAGIRGLYELPLASLEAWLAGERDELDAHMVLNERGDVPGAQKGYCCNGAGNARGFMHEGAFWLPTRGGVIRLVPERITRNPEPPRIVIDRIRTAGAWRPVAPGESPELPADQRDVAFGFSVLSFQDPDSVQVEYRLEGYSSRWQQLDEPVQRQMFYTNLPAGDFSLQVRASNNAGIWSEQPAELDVRIQPRIWETPGFRILMLFFALLLIWLGFNYRLRSLQQKRRLLEQTVAERTEELRIANDSLRDYSSRLETASMTDPLTGLWNRRYLISQLPADLAHFHRELARPGMDAQSMVFSLLDIDLFKRINDQHGHGAGDDVLQQLASLLRDQVRTGDYIIRWGGEEFLFVFRPMPIAESAGIARRIVDAVRKRNFRIGNDQLVGITCSMGVVEYPVFRNMPGALDWENTVALADKALFHVKRHGRDGWCLLRPGPWVEPATLADRLDADIEELIESNQVKIETGDAT